MYEFSTTNKTNLGLLFDFQGQGYTCKNTYTFSITVGAYRVSQTHVLSVNCKLYEILAQTNSPVYKLETQNVDEIIASSCVNNNIVTMKICSDSQ